MIHLFVPGKMVIAGEYAVLEEGQACVVLPVSRGIHISLEAADTNRIVTDIFPGKSYSWSWDRRKNQLEGTVHYLPYIRRAIAVVTAYTFQKRGHIPPVEIHITSHMHDKTTGKKLGIGSSSAVTVAVVEGLCLYYHLDISRDTLFKLAYTAHYMEQGSGSGADIAASAFKSCVHYTAPSQKFMKHIVQNMNELNQYIANTWPLYDVKMTSWDPCLHLVIGWTGEVRKTHGMIQKYYKGRRRQRAIHQQFLEASQKAVRHVWYGLVNKEAEVTLDGVRASYDVLKYMTDCYRIPYLNEALRMLMHYAPSTSATKPSGAGGGDCGIVILYYNNVDEYRVDLSEMVSQWQNHNIYPISMEVYMGK